MNIKEAEHITRELRQKGVVSIAAIKADEGVNVVLNGEWRQLVPLAVTMVHSLMEKTEDPLAARLAFMACIMDQELRSIINDAEGELIYDEEDEK